MVKRVLIAALLGIWTAVPGISGATEDATPTAFATLQDREGVSIGRVEMRETGHGVLMSVHLLGAPPGVHALHVHERGTCRRPDFESAGDHFSPEQRQHGFLAPNGPHPGDLLNLHVPQDGHLDVEIFAADLALPGGAPNGVLDQDGAAIVLHGGRDDYMTQPAGDAGVRLACGVIHRPPASAW